MRLAHTSDWHLDEHNRFDETRELLKWFVHDVSTRKPEMILIAGDTWPVSVRPSTPLERKVIKETVRDLQSIAPVLMVRGNHDVAEHDLDILRDEPNVYVYSEPGVTMVGRDGYCAMVAAFPWPSKAYLLRAQEESGKSIGELCRAGMQAMLRSCHLWFDKPTNLPRIILAHLHVSGSKAGGFTPLGQDVEVTVEDLMATGADYVALGHIHQHQGWNKKVKYSGSLRKVDFGEEGETKGYIIADVERDKDPLVQFIETPGRRMETIEVDLSDPFSLAGKRFNRNSQARLIIRVNEDELALLDMGRILEQLGATDHPDLKIDRRINPTQRVRSIEVQSAKTDMERLVAYLNTLEPKPDREQMQRLKVMFEEVTS